MSKVTLLPRGAFELNGTDDNGNAVTYRGRFSMYAIDAFLQARGIDNYMDMIDRISAGMSVGEYADLIAAALNDYDRTERPINRAQAMDIVDQIFDGIGDKEFTRLIMHAVGRIAPLPAAPGGEALSEEEKKSGQPA